MTTQPDPFIRVSLPIAVFLALLALLGGIVIGRATLLDETNDELNLAWARTYDAEADARALFNLLDYKCADGAAAELQNYSGLMQHEVAHFGVPGPVLIICEPAQGYDPVQLKKFLCESPSTATARFRRFGMC